MNKMQLIVLLSILACQIHASFNIISQSCHQNEGDPSPDDPATVHALQHVCERSNDHYSTKAAQEACTALRDLFSRRPRDKDNLTMYLGPQSSLYVNRADSNWLVQ